MDCKIMKKEAFTVLCRAKTFKYEEGATAVPRFWAEHCAAGGRDPATIEFSAAVGGDVGSTDPAAVTAEADALADAGVSLLTIATAGPDYDLTGAAALCRWRDRR